MTNNQERRKGADGKLYFTFNQGAEFEMRPPYSDVFNYRIIKCEFDELTETEYYRIESAGEELPARYSVSQLKFMLSQLPYEQKIKGDSVELPLLLEEVRAFFAAKFKELKKANIKENDKLKGTSWNSNLQAIKTISENLRYYRANGDQEKADELQANLEKLEAEQKKILTEKGVDVRILTKATDCPLCNDTGIKDGKICTCARDMADKIKAYNAELRLARR